MLDNNCEVPSFLSLAEEYLRIRRAEGAYSIERFANEFPHLREKIIAEFPALVVAESLKETKAIDVLPETLGRYQLGPEIGRGAMGIVVSGSNPDLESEVAIKLLPFNRIRSIEVLQRFHSEAKICAAMDHPNIVPVFDYGTDQNFAFLVMRKVTGMSLDRVIAGLAENALPSDSGGTQLEWNSIISVGIQAADALHYAHEQGVIHRDIKPANLILEKDGRLWVSDFGLSKVLSSDVNLSMTGDVLGTPRYMAPEQLKGVYNACTDVYSLGVSLYELATTQPVCDPSMDLAQLIANKPTLEFPNLKTRNPEVPDALCEVIMQAVELRPEDRFANANELSIALKQATTGTFIGDRRIKDRAASRRSLVRNVVFASCMSLLASAGVYMLAPNFGGDLATMLSQPDKIQQVLDQEDSREIIIEQIPGLIETALKTDDKETRELFAEFAVNLFEPSLLDEDGMSERQLTEGSLALKRTLDAYVESGMQSAKFRESYELGKEESMASGRLSPEQIERLSKEISASSMVEKWKEYSLKQISRYQQAIDSQLFSNNQMWRIKNFLVSLSTDGRNSGKKLSDYTLGPDKLRYFISMLETELNLANASVADSPRSSSPDLVNNTQSTPANSSVRHVHNSQDRTGKSVKEPRFSELLDKAAEDPRLQGLLDKATDDPRLQGLLDKATDDPRLHDLLNKARKNSQR